MHVYIQITRSKPEIPRVIRISDNKVAFISRIYTEAPASDEEPGWSDWTTDVQPYYKFKYTPRYGQRVVFIVPKTVQLSLEEFSKAVEKTRWFKALKKWATVGWVDLELDGITSSKLVSTLIETVYRLLTKRELFCCGQQVVEFITKIPERIRRLNCEIEAHENISFIVKETFESGEYCTVLPFTIEISITMNYDEFVEYDGSGLWYTVPVRDYLRLILEISKKPRFIDFSKIPDRTITIRHLRVVIKELLKRELLREDYSEKIALWLRYQRHFRTTLD